MMSRHVRRLLIVWGMVSAGGMATAGHADGAETGRVGLSAVAAGARRYSLGEWAALSIQATNPTNAEAEGTLVVYFEQEAQHQYARQVWLPPNSKRMTWLPVRAPRQLPDPAQSSIKMTMLPILESSAGEVIQRPDGQELARSMPLSIDQESHKTAAIFRKPLLNERGEPLPDPDSDVYELMAAARELSGQSRLIMSLPDDFSPPHPAMWKSVDQCILCGDRILDDSAGLAALRDWLFRGGRMCVFLDRTGLETVSALLGHGHSLQVVDRVELDEFSIDVAQAGASTATDRRRFERPAELVRVVAENVDVACRINGWPAAFWQQAGNGEVLFVALSPAGWRTPPPPLGRETLPEYSDPQFRTQHALRSWAARFYQKRPQDRLFAEELQPVLGEQIGYQIPRRGVAAGLLGLNGIALVLGGWWLAQRKQLEWLAALSPVLAGVTSAVFLGIGLANNQSVPPTVAYTQLVQVIPETHRARVSGLAAMYQPSTRSLAVTGGAFGLFLPADPPGERTVRRLLWSDSDQGRWLNVSLLAGTVQHATFDQCVPLPSELAASGRFEQAGFVGQLSPFLLETTADAVIAALPAPATAVHIRSDGTLAAGSQDVLPAGQYLAGTVISDESRRRQEIFRSLLVPRDDLRIASTPTLFAWLKPLPGILSIPADVVSQGTALAAIPLRLEPTPPGTEFTVPPTFIRVESVVGKQGVSTVYSERKGTWVTDASRAANTRLRFVLPRQVLPCQLVEASLTVKLNAPSRALQVFAVRRTSSGAAGGGPEELVRQIDNPSGVFQISVTRPEWLALDEGGGVQFGIGITEAEMEREPAQDAESDTGTARPRPPPLDDPAAAPPENLAGSFAKWVIDYVRLDVRGRTP